MAKTKIKASQVVEDTLEDKDGNTKVSVETSSNEDKIRFTTAGTERMIITDEGKVGIGTSVPGYALDVNGDIRIRGNDIRDNSGEKVIEMDGSGYLKFTKGIKYARGVLASSSSSPAEDGGWIKFASFTSPGASNLDTAASSFLVCFAGQESTNNRQLDGLFLVHAKHTVNTGGTGTDGTVTNAYYEPEGTFVVCEPLQASVMSAAGVDDFDPSTGLLMILENDNSSPVVDLYMQCAGKGKRCFVTHLGGTGQEDTADTDVGFTINTGESWLTAEPTAPAGSVKLTGNYTDKRFNNVSTNDLTAYGSITTEKVHIDSSGRIAMQATSDPSTATNYAHIYSKDVSSSAEVFVRDEAGNVTQISPHNDEGEWQYFSRNTKTGKVVKVNMEKMIRKLEEITGESFMEEYYEDPTDT